MSCSAPTRSLTANTIEVLSLAVGLQSAREITMKRVVLFALSSMDGASTFRRYSLAASRIATQAISFLNCGCVATVRAASAVLEAGTSLAAGSLDRSHKRHWASACGIE